MSLPLIAVIGQVGDTLLDGVISANNGIKQPFLRWDVPLYNAVASRRRAFAAYRNRILHTKRSAKYFLRLSTAILALLTAAVTVACPQHQGGVNGQCTSSVADNRGVSVEARPEANSVAGVRQQAAMLEGGRPAELAWVTPGGLDSAVSGQGPGVGLQAKANESRPRDLFNPLIEASEPENPGVQPGQLAVTKAFCKRFKEPGGGAIKGNVIWTWSWMASDDTDGDGRRTSADGCPCQWELASMMVEHRVEGLPLDC